ncbi:shugoshin 2 isoform X1 [Engystomops pustulosus]|uniref:shugoshin 2 isoform X1 n=1 Tax=Engystomops pustulosus TaxID=76066 RepID=UPI003AFA9F84
MNYSASSSLQSVKERMREKLNGSLKVVKLQTSLAAKIKTKTLNNSSILKVSLKHNNKALACALTAEKEKSRCLGNDIMFLQKEVKSLHFQNALLRQNLSIVNKMLKDIDIFMNVNLSSAIEISSQIESADCLSLNETKSERFSQQSALSMDDDPGFRLTGVALRVPSQQKEQKCSSHQSILGNEANPLIVPASPVTAVIKENCDKQDKTELQSWNSTSKDTRSRDSLTSVNINHSILPLDEVFSFSNRNAQSGGGFVTKRKKRSTVSNSSTVSIKSRCSTSMNRESSSNAHWEISTDGNDLPDTRAAERCFIDPVLQKERLSTLSHCSPQSKQLETCHKNNVGKDIRNALYNEDLQSTNHLELAPNEERHHVVDGHEGQEKTVYEADMEMTSSESASIIAVLPKKTQVSKEKSCIPVKQTGALRKVKQAVREKTNRTGSSTEQQVNNPSKTTDTRRIEEKSIQDLTNHDQKMCVSPEPMLDGRSDCIPLSKLSNPEVSPSNKSLAESIFSEKAILLNRIKSEFSITSEKDHCMVVENIADMAPKKRKSKTCKKASQMESVKIKKRKMHKKDCEQVAKENDFNDHIDCAKKTNAKLNVAAKNQEPVLRRETYVIRETDSVENDLVSKIHVNDYRRETFVVSEPSPWLSVNLKTSVYEKMKTLVEPQNNVKSSGSTDICGKAGTGSKPIADSEKEHCNPSSEAEDAYDYKKLVSRCPEKKPTSGIFSEFDKRKTYIVPGKHDNCRDEKGTLVRESFMNLALSQRDESSKFPDIMPSKNDSFMLDMVSESILENTMEFSSFVEFPSATNPESTFTIDMSLKNIPAPDLPVSEDCHKELSQISNHINVLDENENGHQKVTYEIEDSRQCKVEDQTMEIPETAVKPFQDLTNTNLGATKQSPKSCSEDEESQSYTRRRRNPVNYKEPSLGKKLRREDTDIAKGKGKPGGRRNKKVKCESEDE